MILRPKDDGECELIREAYVHGMMHGELMAKFPPREENYLNFTIL